MNEIDEDQEYLKWKASLASVISLTSSRVPFQSKQLLPTVALPPSVTIPPPCSPIPASIVASKGESNIKSDNAHAGRLATLNDNNIQSPATTSSVAASEPVVPNLHRNGGFTNAKFAAKNLRRMPNKRASITQALALKENLDFVYTSTGRERVSNRMRLNSLM